MHKIFVSKILFYKDSTKNDKIKQVLIKFTGRKDSGTSIAITGLLKLLNVKVY